MLTPEDRAWVAGVLDSHGKINIKNNKQRDTPQVVLTVLHRRAAVIGGLAKLTGTSAEQLFPTLPQWMKQPEPDRVSYKWAVTGATAGVVLHGLRPYLRDWDRFGDALDMIGRNIKRHGWGAGRIRVAMTRMESLGWEIPAGWVMPSPPPPRKPARVPPAAPQPRPPRTYVPLTDDQIKAMIEEETR